MNAEHKDERSPAERLSWLLRVAASVIDLPIGRDRYIEAKVLTEHLKLTLDELFQLTVKPVLANHYQWSHDQTRLRAVDGHVLAVKAMLDPPDQASRYHPRPEARQDVLYALGEGQPRKGFEHVVMGTIALPGTTAVDAKAARKEGIRFYKWGRTAWVVGGIPARFLLKEQAEVA